MIAGMPPEPTRRAALRVAGTGALALGLSACGIRLESDAPRIPLVPTRTPRPGEDGLRALLDNGTEILAACAAWTGPDAAPAATLAGLVRTQDASLTGLLAAAGAPTPTVLPTTPTPTSTGSGGSAARTGRIASTAAGILPELVGIDVDLIPTVVSVVASRVAWATTLGQPDSLVALTMPSATASASPAPSSDGSADWLEPTRGAQYAFQVVAARSAGDQRLRALNALELLDRVEAAQVAALPTTAPPEPVGFALPFEVKDAGSARKLAVHAAEGLRASYATDLGSSTTPGAMARATHWLSVAERLVIGWGGKAEPFPGLVT